MSRGSRNYAWRFVREFVLPHRWVCTLLVFNGLLQVLLLLWLPYATKEMVDGVLTKDTPNMQRYYFLILSVAAVYAGTQALTYLFNRLMYRLVAYISQRLRTRVADQLLLLSQQFYDTTQMGRLMVTALGDPSNISQQLAMGMINALVKAVVIFAGCGILFGMNATLSWAVICVFPVMVAIFFILRPPMVQLSEKARESWGIASGIVNEKVAGIRVVRSFAAEEVETRRFRERMDIHADLNVRSSRLNGMYGFLNGLCIHGGYMIVYGLGGVLYFRGQITLGTIVAFYGYFNYLVPAVTQICNLPQQILSARGSLDKVFGLLDEPVLIVNRPAARRFEEPIREIVFDKVSFRYGEHLPLAIHDLNLRIRGGDQIGIVGPSGSGKSTLMALLLRFYEPTEGTISVNGRDIRDWEMQSLRRAFALVPQELALFTGSVRENLLFSRENRDDARIWAALEQAEAASFIKDLDRGLDSRIGERGVSLSGGQKQRLSIARALLNDPQCLILDNCTSALDGETEQRLQATLRKILEGKSAIIISHRASSVIHCGQIWVMDAGRVVESGGVKDLLAAPGYFHSIHLQQAGAA
ncbi:MAG: ABC transporter ATP-binding protein [candidate division FCPU426 bacterium]